MQGCHVMAKPASSRCNLRCEYCFYIDKPQQPLMDDGTLAQFVRQHIAAQPGETVQFAWQGGEPTLAGLAFFKRAVALQHKYAAGRRIENTLQTNGTLLDGAWCTFLRENGWLVGISIDGPALLHDRYRVSRSGKPTHHRVEAAIKRLRACGVEFNLMVVVNRTNCQQPLALYQYLVDLGTPFIQFIPLVERDAAGNLTPESVEEAAWGTFLNTVFDLWVRHDIGRVYIQIFDSTLGVWCGHNAQMCAFSKTCGHAFALETNGDVYQCDHYVYPEYRIGNLHQVSLAELNASHTVRDFGNHKRSSLHRDCQHCNAAWLCNGDCPKHRMDSGKSALCRGYHQFFTHSAPYMKVMRDLIMHQRSPAELMGLLRK